MNFNQKCDAIFDSLDVNQDNSLDFKEFTAFTVKAGFNADEAVQAFMAADRYLKKE